MLPNSDRKPRPNSPFRFSRTTSNRPHTGPSIKATRDHYDLGFWRRRRLRDSRTNACGLVRRERRGQADPTRAGRDDGQRVNARSGGSDADGHDAGRRPGSVLRG
jgi:hypothetical protein